MQGNAPARRSFSGVGSVNAKQIEQPVFQAGPNRCESDHGCHFVRVAQLDQSATVRRWRPQVRFLPWTPFAPVPQQPQDGFRKLVFVGASPTRGSTFQQKSGLWCNSSTSACGADGPGANPGFLTISFLMGRSSQVIASKQRGGCSP